MRFAFNDDQMLLAATLRDFLTKECTSATVRAIWDDPARVRPLWSKLAELGVPGALVPDARGGMGLDERDLVLLLEETGRAALPAPVVSTAAVGAALVREIGGALAETWLPRIAAGEALVASAHPTNPFVADADDADLLLLPAGEGLHAVERSAVAATLQPANDPARRLYTVGWTPTAASRVAAGADAARLLDAALDRGALACAAQALGVADRLLGIAVDYARQREQFGRPIGSFQALQHRLADAKVRLEYARPVVYKAAWSVAAGAASRAVDASHAKLAAVGAATLAARTALQVHGAIGYTWEQDLHLWMRRAWSLERDWGDAAFHEARVAAFVLAPDARIGPGTTFPS